MLTCSSVKEYVGNLHPSSQVSQQTAAKNIRVSTSTIDNIIKRYKESGDECQQ